jgi:hypothetical protein
MLPPRPYRGRSCAWAREKGNSAGNILSTDCCHVWHLNLNALAPCRKASFQRRAAEGRWGAFCFDLVFPVYRVAVVRDGDVRTELAPEG